MEKGRDIETSVYREAYSGRIAAYYHNNRRLFGSSKFTLVPRQAFRGEVDAKVLDELQTVRDACDDPRDFRGILSRLESRESAAVSQSRKCVENGLMKVT